MAGLVRTKGAILKIVHSPPPGSWAPTRSYAVIKLVDRQWMYQIKRERPRPVYTDTSEEEHPLFIELNNALEVQILVLQSLSLTD